MSGDLGCPDCVKSTAAYYRVRKILAEVREAFEAGDFEAAFLGLVLADLGRDLARTCRRYEVQAAVAFAQGGEF